MMKKNILNKNLILILFFCIKLNAQNNFIDSLKLIIKKSTVDTVKVNCLNSISKKLWQTGQLDTSLYYAEIALKLSQKVKFTKGQANAFANIGVIYLYVPDYDLSEKNLLEANRLYAEINNPKRVGDTYNNLGEVTKYKGLYPKAIEYHSKALKIREEIKDSIGIAMSLNNLAIVHEKQSNYKLALKNYNNALSFYKTKNMISDIARTYNNISELYRLQYKLDTALLLQLKSLELRKQINEQTGLIMSYNNMATIYYTKATTRINSEIKDRDNMLKEALSYSLKTKELLENSQDKFTSCNVELNLGAIYLKLKDYKEAEIHLLLSLENSKKLGIREVISRCYQLLSELYNLTGRYKIAYQAFELHYKYKDSLVNEQNKKNAIESQLQYDFDRKQALIEAEQLRIDAETERKKEQQKFILYVVIFILILVVIFTLFIYGRFKVIQKQKKIIEFKEQEVSKQNEVILTQKEVLEEKQHEILASIRYAERIQKSLMPTEKFITRILKKSFK